MNRTGIALLLAVIFALVFFFGHLNRLQTSGNNRSQSQTSNNVGQLLHPTPNDVYVEYWCYRSWSGSDCAGDASSYTQTTYVVNFQTATITMEDISYVEIDKKERNYFHVDTYRKVLSNCKIADAANWYCTSANDVSDRPYQLANGKLILAYLDVRGKWIDKATFDKSVKLLRARQRCGTESTNEIPCPIDP